MDEHMSLILNVLKIVPNKMLRVKCFPKISLNMFTYFPVMYLILPWISYQSVEKFDKC